ncbi:hypothetical protein JTB14_022397 [Gonioctena quinquepunctata]|nr:hypothetical protein JTB14_022397 [Gonioctena quinquepunctata]
MQNNQEVPFSDVPDLITNNSSQVKNEIPSVEEENWDDGNYSTYIPNLERDIVRGPLIGKPKKGEKAISPSGATAPE